MLLDTEGIDSYDQTGRYSTQVFCLALLLSSVFVYNQARWRFGAGFMRFEGGRLAGERV